MATEITSPRLSRLHFGLDVRRQVLDQARLELLDRWLARRTTFCDHESEPARSGRTCTIAARRSKAVIDNSLAAKLEVRVKQRIRTV